MASLLAATGPHAGARFEIGEELAIGRAAVCQVCLAEDGKVSRRHARVLARSGLHLLVDLGSRNGTLLNGERIQGEAPLQPGDRIQVGDTLFVFDVPLRASVEESAEQVQRAEPAEQVLPSGGEASAVLRAATALVSCQSEAAVLRRGAEEARRALRADLAAALLPGELGLATAAVVGASEVKVPRALMRAADRREVARMGSAAIAPLWIGGSGLGALYVERQSEAMAGPELGLLASLGRLMGEAIAAARTRVPPPTEGVLVGSSRVFRRALAEVRRAAATSETAILIGEPGTGKALVAHYLHARSPRALGPFVQVDCRAPTPQLAEELWGRAAGAGGPPRPSALSRADGGTLVLLAAEALPHELAARLARELSGLAAAHPPGAGETAADVRLVATVRESVAVLAAGGRIDLDLAQVLEGAEVPLPPLRERRTDILLLFDHFAASAARVSQGKAPVLCAEAKDQLLSHPWPGNARELKLYAERLTLTHAGQEISSAALSAELAGSASPTEEVGPLADAVARLEREAIARALRKADGKKIRAAALLGISRPTLDKKLALYKIPVR